MPDVNALARLVQLTMDSQGFTLDAVSKRGGLAIATVSAFKNGTRGTRPRPETLRKLAKGLQLDPKVLLEAAGLRTPPDPQTSEEEMILAAIRGLREEDRAQAIQVVLGALRGFKKGAAG